MRVVIDFIDHKSQRYETVGDWQYDPRGDLRIKVSSFIRNKDLKGYTDLLTDKESICIALHELVESILCRFNEPEITDQIVDDFDLTWKEHDGIIEPGEDPKSPYHVQHRKATIFEFQLASALGLNWQEYCNKVDSIDE